MGVALAQLQIRVSAEGLHHMAALIATHHASRHISGPHQSRQSTGVVTAEPQLLIKQKGIQISNRAGLKAVAEGLTPKPSLHCLQPFAPRGQPSELLR